MSDETKIEWCDRTWSPWYGCTKVSPGCKHCYAEGWAKRFGRDVWGRGKPRQLNADWDKPRRWNEQAAAVGKVVRVFPSLCDVFDAEVPVEWLERFFRLINATPNLRWLVLTKRPEMVDLKWWKSTRHWGLEHDAHLPLNLWLGVSAEDALRAFERVPILLRIRATVRWLSVEPMLGPVMIEHWVEERSNKLDWVVVGGESGAGARPCDIAWIRAVVEQCQRAMVPCFVKQLGSNPVMEPGPIGWPVTHPKGGDPSEWPAGLRVREWPAR